MLDNKPIESHLTLKVQRNPRKENSGDSSNATKDKIHKTQSDLMSIVKIITMACLADDETSSEFLSEYENYKKLSGVVDNLGLSENFAESDVDFSLNPTKCWMTLITACIIALHAFPDKSKINCDIIGRGKTSKESEKHMGMCYSMAFQIEAYDWLTHTIELFIPSDADKNKILFIVDDEIRLFA